MKELLRPTCDDHARGIAGPILAQFEGCHRSTGGSALRAAVLGASALYLGLTTSPPAGYTFICDNDWTPGKEAPGSSSDRISCLIC